MSKYLSEIIKTPEEKFGKEYSLEDYIEISKENLSNVFGIEDNEKKAIPFEYYSLNKDHGAEHTYNVYKKSLEIANIIYQEIGIKSDKILLYIMSGMHDSGRFRYSLENNNDTQDQKEAKKRKKDIAEKEHAKYGIAQIKLALKKLKSKGIQLDFYEILKIKDYILNHDFFNTRLDGDKYTEPSSLEGQITRLSDRISVSIEEEIERYRETGKRLNTKYFKNNISFHDRINFTFSNIGDYINSGKFDEITFFLALLSQSENDFSHPIIAKLYKNRSFNKIKGIQKILDIAKEEGYSDSDIEEINILIYKYLSYFNIKF